MHAWEARKGLAVNDILPLALPTQHFKIDGISPLSKMYSIFLCIPRKYVWLVSFLYYLCEIRSRNLFTGNLNPRLDNCRPIFASWNFPLNGKKKG